MKQTKKKKTETRNKNYIDKKSSEFTKFVHII